MRKHTIAILGALLLVTWTAILTYTLTRRPDSSRGGPLTENHAEDSFLVGEWEANTTKNGRTYNNYYRFGTDGRYSQMEIVSAPGKPQVLIQIGGRYEVLSSTTLRIAQEYATSPLGTLGKADPVERTYRIIDRETLQIDGMKLSRKMS